MKNEALNTSSTTTVNKEQYRRRSSGGVDGGGASLEAAAVMAIVHLARMCATKIIGTLLARTLECLRSAKKGKSSSVGLEKATTP